MAYVYSVTMEATIKDEGGIINALKEKRDEYVRAGKLKEYENSDDLSINRLISTFLCTDYTFSMNPIRCGDKISFMRKIQYPEIGYDRILLDMFDAITEYLDKGTISIELLGEVGKPHSRDDHRSLFKCSIRNAIEDFDDD